MLLRVFKVCRRSLETKGKKLLREFSSTAVLDFQVLLVHSVLQSLVSELLKMAMG